MNSRDAFKANLPIFDVNVRGNVVADSETFIAKSGLEYTKVKLAHNFSKDGDCAFIVALLKDEGKAQPIVKKGDYIEVSGRYTEKTNETERGTFTDRTIFATSITVLGFKEEAPKAPTVPARSPASAKSSRKR